MNVALWIVAGLLAAANVASGLGKAVQPYEKLVENPKMVWAQDFSAGAVRAIGGAEVLGGIGLILPRLTGIAHILTPVAAACLAALQLGAMIVHARRHEFSLFPINIVLLVLAAFVAVGRFGSWS